MLNWETLDQSVWSCCKSLNLLPPDVLEASMAIPFPRQLPAQHAGSVFCGEYCDAKASCFWRAAASLIGALHQSYASQHQDNAANKPEKKELSSAPTHEQQAPLPVDVRHVMAAMQVCTPPSHLHQHPPLTQTRICTHTPILTVTPGQKRCFFVFRFGFGVQKRVANDT